MGPKNIERGHPSVFQLKYSVNYGLHASALSRLGNEGIGTSFWTLRFLLRDLVSLCPLSGAVMEATTKNGGFGSSKIMTTSLGYQDQYVTLRGLNRNNISRHDNGVST